MPNASFQIWCEAKYTNRHTYSKQHNPQRPTTRYDVKLNTQTDRRTQSKKNTNTHYQIWRKTKYINRQVYLKQHKPQIITKYGEILWCKTRYTNRHTYAKQHKPQTPNTRHDLKLKTHICKETQTANPLPYIMWNATQVGAAQVWCGKLRPGALREKVSNIWNWYLRLFQGLKLSETW